jgi:hypothetical protein
VTSISSTLLTRLLMSLLSQAFPRLGDLSTRTHSFSDRLSSESDLSRILALLLLVELFLSRSNVPLSSETSLSSTALLSWLFGGLTFSASRTLFYHDGCVAIFPSQILSFRVFMMGSPLDRTAAKALFFRWKSWEVDLQVNIIIWKDSFNATRDCAQTL